MIDTPAGSERIRAWSLKSCTFPAGSVAIGAVGFRSESSTPIAATPPSGAFPDASSSSSPSNSASTEAFFSASSRVSATSRELTCGGPK